MDETLHALLRLWALYRSNAHRLIVWVGAGASRWNNLPLWTELVAKLELAFQHSPNLDYAALRGAIESHRLPVAMRLFRNADGPLYHRTVAKALTSMRPTPLFARFLGVLDSVSRGTIITTNIDDCLDKGLDRPSIVRRDIGRSVAEHVNGNQHILKLHGTLADSSSWVLTDDDYDSMLAEPGLLPSLRSILAGSSVLFIGTGMQDEYLLQLLARAHSEAGAFGEGPHYWIAPSGSEAPLALRNVLRINYPIDSYGSHAIALSTLETLRISSAEPAADTERGSQATQGVVMSAAPLSPKKSTHVLFDPLPPGTYRTSTEATLASEIPDRPEAKIIFGTGFTADEVPGLAPSGMHDLLVGLICFDTVAVPVDVIDRVHRLLGETRFFQLASSGAFRFLDYPYCTAVAFGNTTQLSVGGLCTFDVRKQDLSKMGVIDRVRNMIRPMPGRELVAQPLIDALAEHVDTLTENDFRDVQSQTAFLLANPHVREVLGITPETPVGYIPPWQAFPVLRLATLVRAKATCSRISVSSAQLDYASDSLIDYVFAPGTKDPLSAGSMAGYVCVGCLVSDLGRIAEGSPGFIDGVLAFRASDAAAALRQEISRKLAKRETAEMPFAVNAALESFIPTTVLEAARASFSRVHVPQGRLATAIQPVAWTDARHVNRVAAWHRRSLAMLEGLQAKHRIADNAPCPCGSGLQLRRCCKAYLRKRITA